MTSAERFNIAIVQPDGYEHAEAFREIAETLQCGLTELSHAAEIRVNHFDPAARNIVLGSNLLVQGQIDSLPPDAILYNFEQLGDSAKWYTPAQAEMFRRFQVWDYSPKNIDFLRKSNPRHTPRHVPLGYACALDRLDKPPVQDIDVLFYGCINPRRQKILDELRAAGLNVVKLFNVYGAERDTHIARAKLVLNVHFFDTQIFEIARVSYLLSNRKAVVSELGPNTEIDDDLRPGLALAPYDGLVQTCVELVRDDTRRAELEAAGHAAFAARPIAPILEPVLKEDPMATAQPAVKIDTVPRTLNIGSGKDFRHDCVNLDITDYWSPDIVTDLARKDLIGSRHDCDRFGEVTLQDGMFDRILCNDVIEHIPDLVSAMTNCLNLLSVGGKMEILVPYDLSFGAWQDPTHLRAFNERSWAYYTDWFWYLGWDKARFHVHKMDFNLSPIGQKLIKDGMPQDELIRTPRAVDAMFVILEKQLLSADDKAALKKFTAR